MPWAAPGSSRPPPHTPGSPGLTTQSLRTIMVMMIWYWKYKGMSSGGPTAREREREERGLGRLFYPAGLEDGEELGGRSQDAVPAL